MAKQPKIEQRKIADFKPDPSNANKGTERGLRILDDSIAQTGLGRSVVVDKNGTFIAGNKTSERAVDRGFEDAIVVHTTGDKLVIVQRDDLDLSDSDPNNPARKLAYYDNRVGEVSLDWNPEQLLADINAGIDFDGLWHEEELNDLLADNIPLNMDAREIPIEGQYAILIECDTEQEQTRLLQQLIDQGLKCRALIS